MSGPAVIPAQCDTVAALVNLTRWLVLTCGLGPEAALYNAERILGIADATDPHGIRPAARAALQEASQ